MCGKNGSSDSNWTNNWKSSKRKKAPNQIVHITPLGWSYGSQAKQTINLTLGEALHAVHHRSQTVAIDGIYSILGLLPYGHLVETDYKEDNNYNVTYLENALVSVVNASFQNNYNLDVLSWSGPRNSQLVPTVNLNGTTNVKGLLDNEEIKCLKEKVIAINERFLHLREVGVVVIESWEKRGSDIELWGKDFEFLYINDQASDLIIEEGDTLIVLKDRVILLIPANP